MAVLASEEVAIHREDDVVRVRQVAREWSIELGFSLVDQTKIVTAASELARNTKVYGGGGAMLVESIEENGRRGLRLTFSDHGPGIADIPAALKDGYTTGSGLGLGLGGARRLVNEFSLSSTVGEGTRVVVVKWKT